ncbi:MAG: lipoyl synthase [Desulfobacterales bacterium]|nr:lipoyl synthase [Desulfobacterales bacterium]MBS3754982.1 lipoyl synthase [Desulfobacterales bacterium]
MQKFPPEKRGSTDCSRDLRKPAWLRRRLPIGGQCAQTRRFLRQKGICTVCEEAACPNRWECFSRRTATFMIMGQRCTRNCRFCAVPHGPIGAPDREEPVRVAAAARELDLQHVVVTSVTRDDLPDQGAGCFVQTIREIRRQLPQASIEVLVPDFGGSSNCLQQVMESGPDVLNHNIETVAGLYHRVRPEADYRRSLNVLAEAAAARPDMPVKSGIMMGLGEDWAAVEQALSDLLASGCSMLTIGQYLQPTPRHLPVEEYVTPEMFEGWRQYALAAGFAAVASGPMVRSSYRAREMFSGDRV